MKKRYTLPLLLLVFVVLATGIVATGCLLYRSQRDSCRTDAEHKLAAVADLKVSELSAWRNELLADAKVFYKNNAFSALVRRSIERPQDRPLQEELQTWIGHFQANEGYDRIALFDTAGNKWMMVSKTEEPITSVTYRKVRDALRSGQMTFADFYLNQHNQKVYLRLFVPILDGQAGGRPLGVLMLRIDPSVYLYPFIQRWPTPSETAETLLIRREGNEAVFLNELKFRKNTALALRVSLDNTNFPSVKVALGQEGIVEGVDYRGMPVLTAVRAVPDSPWFLVAKMDAAEAYAPMREWLWLTVLFVGVLLFGVAVAGGLVWRQRHLGLYREKYEAERKVHAILDQTFGFIGMLTPDGTLIEANRTSLEFAGIEDSDVLGKPFWETPWWTHSREMQDRLRDAIKAASLGEFVRFEATHAAAPDGNIHCVDFSLKPVRNEGGEVIFLIPEGRDITDRKRAEEAIKRTKRQLYETSSRLPGMIFQFYARQDGS